MKGVRSFGKKCILGNVHFSSGKKQILFLKTDALSKTHIGSLHWVLLMFVVASYIHGPLCVPIFRIGPPKLPKTPVRSKKWSSRSPFRVLVWAQRIRVSRPPCIDCSTCVDSVPCEIHPEIATRSSSSAYTAEAEAPNRRVLTNATLATRQLHVAMRWMLEQVTRLEDGDYEQSTAVHGFRDCHDRATEQNNRAYVSCRERLMHNDQQSQSTRVVELHQWRRCLCIRR